MSDGQPTGHADRLGARILRAVGSALDPRSYLHAFRILHYYSYSHVKEKRLMTIGQGTLIAPNVSIRNGRRISIGARSHIGERCYLWAGGDAGRIIIGDDLSPAPEVFIPASDYQFAGGERFRQQPRRERDVIIGCDV